MVVEHLHVFEARSRDLCSYCIAQSVYLFVFETVEPTLAWRMIPAMPLATHGTIYAGCLQHVLERLSGILVPRSSGHSTRCLFGARVLRAGHSSTGTRSSGGSEVGPHACGSRSIVYFRCGLSRRPRVGAAGARTRCSIGRMFLGKPTVPLSLSDPFSIRFSSESLNFVPNSRRRTAGSVWRRLPHAHNPPLPKTPTKLPLTLSSRSWPRDSSPKN